jgi:uncharacterized membrane protein
MDPQQYGQPPTGQPMGQQPGYSQPPYGQPYAGAYAAPLPQTSANQWGPTSLGMEANVAAGLGYLFIIGLIFFFIEKTNRFVKFHAAQAILLSIGGFGLGVVWTVLGTMVAIATSNSLAVSTLLSCVFFLGYAGIAGLWLWGIIAAFSGKYTKLPIIGDIAESWAGGPATPAF